MVLQLFEVGFGAAFQGVGVKIDLGQQAQYFDEPVGAPGILASEVAIAVVLDGFDAVDEFAAVSGEEDEQFGDDDVEVVALFVGLGFDGFVEVFTEAENPVDVEVAGVGEEAEVGFDDGELEAQGGEAAAAVLAVQLVGGGVIGGVEGVEGLVKTQ